MRARVTLALWIVLAIAVAAMQGKQDSSGSMLATPAALNGITRTVLVGAIPSAALDQNLELSRIVIEPGTILPLHVHPGTRLASIVSGELTYYVIVGKVQVNRAAVDDAAGQIETLHAGEQTLLRAGDAVIETEGMQHYAENLGAEQVVILTASLFQVGMPPSMPMAAPAP